MAGRKDRIIVYNKADLADDSVQKVNYENFIRNCALL